MEVTALGGFFSWSPFSSMTTSALCKTSSGNFQASRRPASAILLTSSFEVEVFLMGIAAGFVPPRTLPARAPVNLPISW